MDDSSFALDFLATCFAVPSALLVTDIAELRDGRVLVALVALLQTRVRALAPTAVFDSISSLGDALDWLAGAFGEDSFPVALASRGAAARAAGGDERTLASFVNYVKARLDEAEMLRGARSADDEDGFTPAQSTHFFSRSGLGGAKSNGGRSHAAQATASPPRVVRERQPLALPAPADAASPPSAASIEATVSARVSETTIAARNAAAAGASAGVAGGAETAAVSDFERLRAAAVAALSSSLRVARPPPPPPPTSEQSARGAALIQRGEGDSILSRGGAPASSRASSRGSSMGGGAGAGGGGGSERGGGADGVGSRRT